MLERPLGTCFLYYCFNFFDICIRFAYFKHCYSSAAATVGTAVAVGVTLGKVDSLNNVFVKCAENTADATGNLLEEACETTMNIGRLNDSLILFL